MDCSVKLQIQIAFDTGYGHRYVALLALKQYHSDGKRQGESSNCIHFHSDGKKGGCE